MGQVLGGWVTSGRGAVSPICPRAQWEGVMVLLTDGFNHSFIKVPIIFQDSGRLSVSQKTVRIKQLLKLVYRCKLRSQRPLLYHCPVTQPQSLSQPSATEATKGKLSQRKQHCTSSSILLVFSSSTSLPGIPRQLQKPKPRHGAKPGDY